MHVDEPTATRTRTCTATLITTLTATPTATLLPIIPSPEPLILFAVHPEDRHGVPGHEAGLEIDPRRVQWRWRDGRGCIHGVLA